MMNEYEEIKQLRTESAKYDVSNYFKLKFDGILTRYQKYLVFKIFAYANSFKVTSVDLKSFFLDFSLPVPLNMDFDKIAYEINRHEYVKIQDKTGKEISPTEYELEQCLPSFHLNRLYQSMDKTFVCFDTYIKEGSLDDEGVELLIRLQKSLISYNVWIPQYLYNFQCFTGNEVDFSTFCGFRPIPQFFGESKSIVNSFMTMCHMAKLKETRRHDSLELFMSMYTMVEQLKGYCAFCCLVGILFDSIHTSEKYKVLTDMAFFLLYNFRGSFLYKMLVSVAPLNTKVPAVDRGCTDFTTRLKIFLFSSNGTPTLIRIDLPHKGVPYIHYNVETLDSSGEENHRKIDCEIIDDKDIFTSLLEQVVNECPNLIQWKDSFAEDDKKVLKDMHIFLFLNELSLDYYQEQEDKKHLQLFSEFMGKTYTDIVDAINEGYFYLVGQK